MREILFRGKAKNRFGEPWVEGYFMDVLGSGTPYIATITPIKDGKEAIIDGEIVLPETIGQFTGLTDDKDKKIFEGDIVECYSSDYIGYPKIDTITVKNMTDYNTMVYLNCSNRLVVIGNIHDNPKPLKEGV